ncbi:unnamed protein product [Schistocephalus solidus]|uniref:Uncharacterized protein n=1 Tax=Schistocephalus solidus TaxID=70667 RepID=A0A183T1P4_SCHSO|nr:unnamed protein product [Schistocephalus solidus]
MEAPVYGEVSEKIFRICLPIPHLKAPPKLVPLFKGTSGQFRADKAAAAASGDCKAAFTVFLKNGMIEGEISPLSLRVRCSLREPVVDETFTVPALVAEVIPNKCTYEVLNAPVAASNWYLTLTCGSSTLGSSQRPHPGQPSRLAG